MDGEGIIVHLDTPGGFNFTVDKGHEWKEDPNTFLSHADIPDYPEQTISCNIDTHDWFTLTELLDPVQNWRINYMTQRQLKRAKRRLRRKKARPNKTKQRKKFRDYRFIKNVYDFQGYVSDYCRLNASGGNTDNNATITVKIVE